LLNFYTPPHPMQQPTLESLVALLPSARDIPSLSEHQAKQYFLMARNLLDQILKVVSHLRDPRSRTVNNLRAILEESFGNLEGICSGMEKQKKKLTRFRRRPKIRAQKGRQHSVFPTSHQNYRLHQDQEFSSPTCHKSFFDHSTFP